jgi:hypothetical protein
MSTLANSFVRDDHASFDWSRAAGSSLLNELRSSFSRDDQYSTPTGLVDPALPSVVLSSGGGEDNRGSKLELGNAGFAGGRTDKALWQVSDHVNWLRGRHTLKSGLEFTRAHVTDLAFGGFDPDAQAQNGIFRGTYSFSSLSAASRGSLSTCRTPASTFKTPSGFMRVCGLPAGTDHDLVASMRCPSGHSSRTMLPLLRHVPLLRQCKEPRTNWRDPASALLSTYL